MEFRWLLPRPLNININKRLLSFLPHLNLLPPPRHPPSALLQSLRARFLPWRRSFFSFSHPRCRCSPPPVVSASEPWNSDKPRRFVSLDGASGKADAGAQMKKKPAKTRTVYVCENCGESYGQWWGKCNSCQLSNTLKKFTETLSSVGSGGGAAVRAVEGVGLSIRKATEAVDGMDVNSDTRTTTARTWLNNAAASIGPQRLSDISRGTSQSYWRLPLAGENGLEIARVLGGGLVPGSLILVGGDPGVGKSTLLLQIAAILADGCEVYGPAPVLYVSGEESVEQISNRADRIQISSHELFLYAATDLELILNAIHHLAPRAVVIDSIQTVYLPEATGSAGSVIQVRECAAALLRSAKQTQIPIFLVGHVTKTGDIAGPRLLEHIVDVVLYMEGESRESHRLLRVVKNRFGSTDEVGVFEMVEGGLVAVENPSELFLSQRMDDIESFTSAAVAVIMEGSRPFLVEVQALCSANTQQLSKRTINGMDPQRVFLILAVLTKLAGLKLHNQDILINVVGGLQIREPAADLAIAVAICSSFLEKRIPTDIAFVGEIGLGGELRSVGQLEKRILEVTKLGFQRCIIPKSAEKSVRGLILEGIDIIPCASIQEVIDNAILPLPYLPK